VSVLACSLIGIFQAVEWIHLTLFGLFDAGVGQFPPGQCMYCMRIYVCAYIYVYMHVCIYMYACVHTCMYICNFQV